MSLLKDQIPSVITIAPFMSSTPVSVSPSAITRSVEVTVTSLFNAMVTTQESNDILFSVYQENASFVLDQPDNFVSYPNVDTFNFTFNDSGINNRTFERDATIELITTIVTAMFLGFIILATVIGTAGRCRHIILSVVFITVAVASEN